MLTEVSMGWDNPDDFVAEMLAPGVPVTKQSNKYYIYTRDTWGKVTDDLRSPGARANELPPMTLSRDTYFAEEHALKDVVPVEEQENADDPLQPFVDATERVTNTLELNKEVALVSKFTTTTNFAAGYTVTLSGAQQWNTYGTETPILDVKTGRAKIHDTMFRDPNIAIAQYQVAVKLEDHPSLINRIQYAMVAVTTDELISRLLGVNTFIRAGAGRLTNVYGQPETTGYVWPKVFLLAWVPPRPARKTPAFAYQFNWAYQGGITRATERWFDTDRNADIIRVRFRYACKFIAVDSSTPGKTVAGYLINNAIA
jgi:hypothetical protein